VEGGFSEQLVVKAESVLPKPASVSWEEAASLLLAATTAFHMVEAARVSAGDRVLVHGASGAVGGIAVQLAVLRGAQVVGTASAANLDVVRGFGAEAVDYGDGLADRVRALFADGVNAALNTADADTALDVSTELVADRDRIVTVTGFAHAAELGVKRLGLVPGGDPGAALRDAARMDLVDLAGKGKICVRLARSFPLAEAAAALELVGSGRAHGKVVLVT
jgi:NADPH:quinone reductase-like Zn-dependent oxidoreductase